jgi:tRNA(Ile)-lysidine synthase
MHGFEKKIKNLVSERKLIVEGDEVLVGTSAGPDSTALLLVLSCLGQEMGFTVSAVYVDHGLRPAETPAEKEFLQRLCDDLQIPLTVHCVNVEQETAGRNESVEQMARILRYQVFSRVAKSSGATKIAVGHTADDQAEEVVLRLLRGTARAGLSGMKLLRDKNLVRPLLQVTKDDIYGYLQDKGRGFMVDSSNASLLYLRNQVRLQVLPFLRRYNPAIDCNLCNLALILQDEEDLLTQQTDRIWNDLVTVTSEPAGLLMVQWNCEQFTLLHVALQRRVAEKMFIVMESLPSADKIKQLLYLIQYGQGGGQLHFAHGLRALKKKGGMQFWYPQGRTNRKGNLFTGC